MLTLSKTEKCTIQDEKHNEANQEKRYIQGFTIEKNMQQCFLVNDMIM